MASAKDKLVADVDFVLSEVGRFCTLQQQWYETKQCPEELKEAFLWELPHPTDEKRKVTCGRVAMGRLEDLARVAAKRAGISRQVDVLTVRTPLAKALLRKFGVEKRPLNDKNVERALSEAARHASKALKPRTHFVPCHLMISKDPHSFDVGPIRFLSRHAFRSRLARALNRDRGSFREDRRFLRDAIAYYDSFGWIAEVTIPDCDNKTSLRVAERAVTSALDCLHVLLGARHTTHMTVGGPAINRDRRGAFSIIEDELNFSASYGGPGEAAFGDDWFRMFEDPTNKYILALFGVALEAAVDPRLERPLSNRFLEAAQWFGEAVREPSYGARVIKYVTALERMVMSDEKDDITALVAARVAALCFDRTLPGSRDEWRRKAEHAYTLRSKLAHGSLSPRSERVYDGVRLGAEIGEATLLNGLAAFGTQGLRAENLTRAHIRAGFAQIVENAEQLTAAASELCGPNDQ